MDHFFHVFFKFYVCDNYFYKRFNLGGPPGVLLEDILSYEGLGHAVAAV